MSKFELFSKRAGDSLYKGDLENTKELAGAAELKKALLTGVSYDVVGERVVFRDGWDRSNIITVTIPQLADVPSFTGGEPSQVQFYKDGADQLRAAFSEIESKGLRGEIKEWCGAYVRRPVRNTKILSFYALGLVFDINCGTLRFGRKIDLSRMPGLARVIDVLQRHGFLWGGWFEIPDPMHFQLYRLEKLTAG